MAIRLICIILALFITPHGWYSWLFIAGAAFLPTFGVIVANVAKADQSKGEKATRALTNSPKPTPAPEAVVVIDIAVDDNQTDPSKTDSGEPNNA